MEDRHQVVERAGPVEQVQDAVLHRQQPQIGQAQRILDHVVPRRPRTSISWTWRSARRTSGSALGRGGEHVL